MEIRLQLEVRGLFLKYLSQIPQRDRFVLIKLLENIVNEHRCKSKPNNSALSSSEKLNNKQNCDSYQTRHLKQSFEEFFCKLDTREYNKLINVIEFEIMKPSNLIGYLKDTTPESNDNSSDSDIQIIEVIKPSPEKRSQPIQSTKFSFRNSIKNLNININSSNKSPSKETIESNILNTTESTNSKQDKTEAVKQSVDGKSTKKFKNRILLLQQIAAKQTKASKLKLNKGLFKQIQYKDFVDFSTNKLLDTKLKSLEFKANTITLTANIVGINKSDDNEYYLVEWKPENYAPNEWISKEEFKTEKMIEISKLKANHEQDYLNNLYRSVRHRNNKRK